MECQEELKCIVLSSQKFIDTIHHLKYLGLSSSCKEPKTERIISCGGYQFAAPDSSNNGNILSTDKWSTADHCFACDASTQTEKNKCIVM